MKTQHRDYDNNYYYEFLNESLYLITNRKDGQKSIEKIQNKLKGPHLDIFNKIIFYYCALRIVKIKLSEARHENKDNYFDRDFEKIDKFKILKEECERTLNDSIESVDRDIFLESISEIIYWITKIEGARQLKIHKEFLSSWAQWHRHLERKNRNKLEGYKIKEKLKLILGIDVNDLDKIQKEHDDDVKRFLEGKKNIFVNINHEIDLKTATPNDVLFLPERWLGEGDKFRVIEEHTQCVILNDRKYSLREYYDMVKDEIDENWIKDKDLLKQIITIYLIKRCQNGDEEAYQKLFNFYKNGAKQVRLNYVKIRGKLVESSEVEGRENTILSSLLKGDNPDYLYKTLDGNRENKKGVDVLNKKPYEAMTDSYEYMFEMLSGQYNHIEKKLKDLEKNTKDFRNRLKKKAKKPETRKEYSRKIFTYSQHTIGYINQAPTLFMLLNPIDLLRISPKYDKYLFKPTPNGNLTTWLLGDKNKNFRGMIWLSLCNLFDKRTARGGESFDENEYAEDSGSGIYRKIQKNQEDY